ncbi:AEC family transporter [Desulfovibrio sp. OttesenSCG-928-C06]|nr:AEC family transporter [Desulfovibrio sp. OttesenSCG-928-C06]
MISGIVAALFPIFGIIFLGAIVARCKLLPLNAAGSLSLYVYWIGLPVMMFNFIARMPPENFTGSYFAGVYISTIISYLVCFAATSSFFRKNKREATMLTWMACFPNVAFMGVAVTLLLLPGNQEALTASVMYSVLNSPLMFLTDMRLSMYQSQSKKGWAALGSLCLSMLRNPLLMAPLAGLAICLLRLPQPEPLMNMASMLGATAAPCALFGMGMSLSALVAGANFPAGWLRRQLPVHLVKMLVLPASTYLVLLWLGVSGVTLGAATLASCMPVGVASYVVAEKYRVVPEDTAITVFLSTVMSIAGIPLVITAMYWLGAF